MFIFGVKSEYKEKKKERLKVVRQGKKERNKNSKEIKGRASTSTKKKQQ